MTKRPPDPGTAVEDEAAPEPGGVVGRWVKRHRALSTSGLVTLVWVACVLSSTNGSHTTPYVAGQSRVETDTGAGSAPQRGERAVKTRLLLIGDAGLLGEGSKLLRAATERAMLPATHTAAVYLGDNIYPAGLPPKNGENYAVAAKRLRIEVEAFRETPAQVFFIPGNHDWDNSKEAGRAAMAREEAFITEHGDEQAELLPTGAMPGPECRDVGSVRLIFIDTQWWMHEHDKPDADVQQVYDRVRDCANVATPSVVLTHHPAQTHGPHGGFFEWTDHIFPLTRLVPWLYLPLPLLGSAYPASRAMGVSRQDLTNDDNRKMIDALAGALGEHPPIAWASGHEHSLQVIKNQALGTHTLVSGSASRASAVSHGENTLYAHAARGFMELLFLDDDRVLLLVHAEGESSLNVTYERWLSR